MFKKKQKIVIKTLRQKATIIGFKKNRFDESDIVIIELKEGSFKGETMNIPFEKIEKVA